MEPTSLTVDQMRKFAQAEKQKGERAKAGVMKAGKSAKELAEASKKVAEISKKNPEL
jgi:hypothetical protein